MQTYRINQENKQAQEKYESLQTQATSESQKGDELEQKLEYVRSDEYIESIARERLGLVKKDEILIKSDDN
jgi:cell division protein DivIC